MKTARIFLPIPNESGPGNYGHHCLSIGEGLLRLGWRVEADGGNWLPYHGAEPLFDSPSADQHDLNLVVVDETRLKSPESLPGWLFDNPRHYALVYTDCDDVGRREPTYRHPSASKFDLILRSHFTTRLRYPGNVKPWAFGLTQRIVESLSRYHNRDRVKRLVWNFQHKAHAHTARMQVENRLGLIWKECCEIDREILRADGTADEYEKLMWYQTCGRHCERYYERLATSTAVACFGGWMIPSVFPKEGGSWFRISRGVSKKLGLSSHTILQWDSWRFWEALLAEAAAVNFDFERYGFILPEMPVAGKHYVAVDLDSSRDIHQRIFADSCLHAGTGKAGAEWALKHYSPEACARRLLALLGISL